MTLLITPTVGQFGYTSSRDFEIEHVPHTEYDFDDVYEITIRVSDSTTLQECCNQRCYVVVGDTDTTLIDGEFYVPDFEFVNQPRTKGTYTATQMGRLTTIHLHTDGETDIDHAAIAAHGGT